MISPGEIVRVAPATLLVGVLMAGCAAPASAPSRVEQEAASLNQRAARALEQGDLTRARALYERALRLDTAIEHADGIAANALSLAHVLQLGGEFDAAQRTLDVLLSGSSIPPARSAEALARKAQLYIGAADLARAAEYADRAIAQCSNCFALPAMLNLRGRIALGTGDAASAMDWAARALAAASRGGDTSTGRGEIHDARIERANSLRLTGEARIARGEHALAVQPLEQALALDRALGLAARIRLDLMALGGAHTALGNPEAAAAYYGRARMVSGAANDEAGSRAAVRALEALRRAASAR